MIEILWHGRGGQGAFTAARLLGAAGSLAPGRYGLAFPSFGPERRGAPMRAFTKLDGKAIGDRSAIVQADFVVYLDETLFAPGWESELKPGGRVLLNSSSPSPDERVICLDASGISRAILGRDIPNTALLAAISVLSDCLSPEDAKEAVRQYMAPKLHASNIAIIQRVEEILASQQTTEVTASAAAPTASVTQEVPAFQPPERIIPTLRNAQLDPEEFAATTCWDAGHLVSKNAGWRTSRPVISADACTGCLLCYMQCPDGTIFKTHAPEQAVAVDYDFCKGCGVCAKACKFGAIQMVPENEEAR